MVGTLQGGWRPGYEPADDKNAVNTPQVLVSGERPAVDAPSASSDSTYTQPVDSSSSADTMHSASESNLAQYVGRGLSTAPGETERGEAAQERQAEQNSQRPFFYPVPHTMAEQISRPSSGTTTPLTAGIDPFQAAVPSTRRARPPPLVLDDWSANPSVFSEPGSPRHISSSPVLMNASVSPLSSALQHPSSVRSPSASGANARHDSAASVQGPRSATLHPPKLDLVSSPLHGSGSASPSGSPMSAAPPTPSAISFQRRLSSMMGQPTMWVASQPGTPIHATMHPSLSPARSQAATPGWPGMPTTPGEADSPNWRVSQPGSLPTQTRPVPSHLSPLDAAPKAVASDAATTPLWMRRATNQLRLSRSGSIAASPTTEDAKDAEWARQVAQSAASPSYFPHDPLSILQRVNQSLAGLAHESVAVRRASGLRPFRTVTMSEGASEPLTMGTYTEDGKETLPAYMCTVHIEGYLPCTVELRAPGEPAENTEWVSHYFVLHGTVLHEYDTDISQYYHAGCDPAALWHLHASSHVHPEPMHGPRLDPAPPMPAKLASPETLRAQLQTHLVRSYTMLKGEFGLAADYTTRPHVLRIRLEGTQFLVQTSDDFHLVEWVEALQAAANVCADLDKRAMPKIMTLPRRRRRRRGLEAVALHMDSPSAVRPNDGGPTAPVRV